MVRDSSSNYKIDYVILIKNFLNPEGHQNPMSGSKVMAILLKGLIWLIGEASAGEGLRLQPAQQACFCCLSYCTIINFFLPFLTSVILYGNIIFS